METVLSTEHVDNLKQLLFGQQKQANVINDAVVKLVAKELSSAIGESNFSSIDQADAAVMKYLQGVVSKEIELHPAPLMLIVGEQGLANIKSGQPVTVTNTEASETSTKRNYRINVLGEDAEIDMHADEGKAPAGDVSAKPVTGGSKPIDQYDFRTQAQMLHDAILPLVPDAVKTELPNDEYAQCLVCAETYFKYRS